ncbi:MAG: ribosome small subunit-dependent GTPase A, partial [Thermomicrobiales bacterium]
MPSFSHDLETLGFSAYFAAQFAELARPDLVPARIAADGQSVWRLAGCRAALGELSGKLRHGLAHEERPAVGDWVAVADGEARAIIHHILPRRTALARRAASLDAVSQVIAANVDLFGIVTSANQDLNPRRVERYLAAVWESGASPMIVLNKTDLVDDVAPLRALLDEVALAVPVVEASAATGAGLTDLQAMLAPGKTVAFIGSSGVGKSSLVNRLLGREAQHVSGIREDDARGRHTTTRRELLPLPGGAVLIDTPGMREFGLTEDGGGVDAAFADISELAEQCRFNDCRHEGEPGCAVQAALAAGTLAPERWESYRKLQREAAAYEARQDPA